MFQPQQKLITLGNTKLKFLSVNKNCRFCTRVLDNEHSISSNLGSQGERENFVYFCKVSVFVLENIRDDSRFSDETD